MLLRKCRVRTASGRRGAGTYRNLVWYEISDSLLQSKHPLSTQGLGGRRRMTSPGNPCPNAKKD